MKADRPRIAVVVEATVGGLWAAALADSALARDEDCQVSVYVPESTRKLDDVTGYDLQRYPGVSSVTKTRSLLRARAVIRARTRDLDVIHVHGLRSLLLVWPRRNIYVTYHGARPLNASRLRSFLLGLALSVTPMLVREARTVVPLRSRGWKVIWYSRGSHLEPEPPLTDAGLPRLLWLGRVSGQKDFPLFLNVVKRSRALGLISGGAVAGVFDQGSEALADAAEEAGLELLGHVADVDGLLREDWVVCVFAKFEGRPFAVEEAISSGRPTLASRLPGNMLMIRDERFLISDVSDAIDALCLLTSFEDRCRYGVVGSIALADMRAGYESSDDAMRRAMSGQKL